MHFPFTFSDRVGGHAGRDARVRGEGQEGDDRRGAAGRRAPPGAGVRAGTPFSAVVIFHVIHMRLHKF